MGYDPVRKSMVLVNGHSEAASALRWDTWSYDGSSWQEVPNASTPRGFKSRLTPANTE